MERCGIRPGSREADFENWAFIGLGSNLGDSARILAEAVGSLRGLSRSPLLKSSCWRSAPLDCPPGSRDFLNAVVGLVPRRGLTPDPMLAELQEIERGFGRRPRRAKNEARWLDLDLLVFGRVTCSLERLTLPHPRAHLRRFVLEPWNELAPNLVLPVLGRRVGELLTRLPPGPRVERVAGLSGW